MKNADPRGTVLTTAGTGRGRIEQRKQPSAGLAKLMTILPREFSARQYEAAWRAAGLTRQQAEECFLEARRLGVFADDAGELEA